MFLIIVRDKCKADFFSILNNFLHFMFEVQISSKVSFFAKCISKIQKRQKVVWIETASTFIGKSDDIRILESVEFIIH